MTSASPYGQHDGAPAPDRDVPNVRHAPAPDPLAFGMLAKFGENQAALTEAIKNLKETIEKQGVRIDKIDDIRVDIARISKDVEYSRKELDDTVKKLETVRTWVIAAAGIVALIAALAPVIIPRVWPLPPPSPQAVSGQSAPGAPGANGRSGAR